MSGLIIRSNTDKNNKKFEIISNDLNFIAYKAYINKCIKNILYSLCWIHQRTDNIGHLFLFLKSKDIGSMHE